MIYTSGSQTPIGKLATISIFVWMGRKEGRRAAMAPHQLLVRIFFLTFGAHISLPAHTVGLVHFRDTSGPVQGTCAGTATCMDGAHTNRVGLIFPLICNPHI